MLSVFVAVWKIAPTENWLNAAAPWKFEMPALHFAVQKMPPVVAAPELEKAIYKFNILAMTGTARLSGEDWTGVFDLAHGDTVLGHLTLAHDGAAGTGGLKIDAPSIVFAAGGLQPVDLSPMAEIIGAPASGSVAFEGRIDWRADAELQLLLS